MTNTIEDLLSELPQASRQRVEGIVTILERVLSDIECKFPAEDDADIAYECECIPKARDIILRIREWNARDRTREDGEGSMKIINTLSSELIITLNQIPLVNTDLDQ
ncbi:MAG: hypothetical protein JJE30_10850 [Desulfuromonadales bacterium]|nr:hypothetical protein [Desulfuromonadales bacterium]